MINDVILSETLVTIARQNKLNLMEIGCRVKAVLDQIHAQRKIGFSIPLIMAQLYSRVDSDVAAQKRENAISCTKGCSACCKQNVDITALDAANMVQYARKHAIAIDKDYLVRQSAVRVEQFVFNRALAPCVFLDQQTNLCNIYPVRPLICRFYMVNTPAYLCADYSNPSPKLCAIIGLESEIVNCAAASYSGGFNRMPTLLLNELNKQHEG